MIQRITIVPLDTKITFKLPNSLLLWFTPFSYLLQRTPSTSHPCSNTKLPSGIPSSPAAGIPTAHPLLNPTSLATLSFNLTTSLGCPSGGIKKRSKSLGSVLVSNSSGAATTWMGGGRGRLLVQSWMGVGGWVCEMWGS